METDREGDGVGEDDARAAVGGSRSLINRTGNNRAVLINEGHAGQDAAGSTGGGCSREGKTGNRDRLTVEAGLETAEHRVVHVDRNVRRRNRGGVLNDRSRTGLDVGSVAGVEPRRVRAVRRDTIAVELTDEVHIRDLVDIEGDAAVGGVRAGDVTLHVRVDRVALRDQDTVREDRSVVLTGSIKRRRIRSTVDDRHHVTEVRSTGGADLAPADAEELEVFSGRRGEAKAGEADVGVTDGLGLVATRVIGRRGGGNLADRERRVDGLRGAGDREGSRDRNTRVDRNDLQLRHLTGVRGEAGIHIPADRVGHGSTGSERKAIADVCLVITVEGVRDADLGTGAIQEDDAGEDRILRETGARHRDTADRHRVGGVVGEREGGERNASTVLRCKRVRRLGRRHGYREARTGRGYRRGRGAVVGGSRGGRGSGRRSRAAHRVKSRAGRRTNETDLCETVRLLELHDRGLSGRAEDRALHTRRAGARLGNLRSRIRVQENLKCFDISAGRTDLERAGKSRTGRNRTRSRAGSRLAVERRLHVADRLGVSTEGLEEREDRRLLGSSEACGKSRSRCTERHGRHHRNTNRAGCETSRHVLCELSHMLSKDF